MKKSILTLMTVAFAATACLISCNSPSDKLEKAKQKVIEANKDKEEAEKEYLEDIESYRKETAIQIATNHQTISELKDKIKDQKKASKVEYTNKITQLEQKNSDLKKKMDDYKGEGKDNWESFKKEFKHDMDELAEAFKDFTVNNTK